MALAATIVWEVDASATSGSVNGGGFNSAASGTDKTLSGSYTGTDLLTTNGTNASPVVSTTSSHSFGATDVGNIIHINSGGTFTAGWYEIKSVSAGAATLDRACSSGASTSGGTYHVGGALSLGNAVDSTWATTVTAGNIIYVKAGTSVSMNTTLAFTNGTNLAPCSLLGYSSSRGDNPTGSSRPTINLNATQWGFGALTLVSNIIWTGTQQTPLTSNGQCVLKNCKMTNTSTTTGRFAFSGGSDDLIYNCEAISYNGIAINFSSDGAIVASYIHDSQTGVKFQPTGSFVTVIDSIIESCFGLGVSVSAANTGLTLIRGNTFYGAETPLGTGLSLATTASNVRVTNNIFYGLTTAASAGSADANLLTDYNCFNNNTTNVSNWSIGTNSSSSNPTFSSVGQYTGSTATSSGTTLTDGGATFTNVVDGRDFLYVSASTGGNTGKFLIQSHTGTTVTVDNTLATGTAVHYSIGYAHNFAIGTNLKGAGFPGAFQSSQSTGYRDIGAVQRQEQGGALIAGGCVVG